MLAAEYHGQWLAYQTLWGEGWYPVEWAMVARKKTIQCSQLHSGELWHIVSVHDGNHNVEGIFVGLSWELQCWQQSDRVLKQWWTMGREKGSEPHHQSEFLCNYYTLSECRQQYRQCGQNLHRPFLQAVRFHYLFNCILHYIMEHNFPLPGV